MMATDMAGSVSCACGWHGILTDLPWKTIGFIGEFGLEESIEQASPVCHSIYFWEVDNGHPFQDNTHDSQGQESGLLPLLIIVTAGVKEKSYRNWSPDNRVPEIYLTKIPEIKPK